MKKTFLFITCISFILIFSACKEQGQSKEKSVEEIKLENKTSISKLIRQPISANKSIDTINVAKLDFEESIYDFGTVSPGEIVSYTFKFTNTGKIPLIITDAKSTCGCTVPTWPKNPIAPGEKEEIKVKFDTKGKTKRQSKPITIISNTYPNETKIYMTGFVSTDNEKIN